MPFDEGHMFRGALDYIANRSAVGTVMMHPIWFTLVLVTTILIVLVVVGWDGSPTFKLVFYMLMSVGSAVLAHDALTDQHHRECNETSATNEIVEAVQASGGGTEIAPRELGEMPESFMVDAGRGYVQPVELTAAEVERQIMS